MGQLNTHSLELVRAAAKRGVCEAQLMYGQILLDGIAVRQNATAALHWFERSALGGNVMAINMVGRCLDQGWGVAASPAMAAQWFRKAAERGLDWGMYNLATLLTLGSGVVEDKVEALFWLRRAAALDHAKSINLLGGFYEDGWTVRKDMSQARTLYLRAAEGGDFRGQFNYARLLLLDGNYESALHWLQKVPLTATPQFLGKMEAYLRAYPRLQPFIAGMATNVSAPLLKSVQPC